VIIETILTTQDDRGAVNFAPMGVEWGEETIVIKPFLETTTFRNLRRTVGCTGRRSEVVRRVKEATPSEPQRAGGRRKPTDPSPLPFVHCLKPASRKM
jgi:hypothetical protein